MSHKHVTKKIRISFIEYDDVLLDKLGDARYFGEGNSKGRRLDFDFEYCPNCSFRLLNGKPVMSKGILDEELEVYVVKAKKNSYVQSKEVTVQHGDFEILERLIQKALALGKFRESLVEEQKTSENIGN